MSPRFVLGRENVPCVAEVVNRSLKADCTDFTTFYVHLHWQRELVVCGPNKPYFWSLLYPLEEKGHKCFKVALTDSFQKMHVVGCWAKSRNWGCNRLDSMI